MRHRREGLGASSGRSARLRQPAVPAIGHRQDTLRHLQDPPVVLEKEDLVHPADFQRGRFDAALERLGNQG
eukprot:9431944-Alexandrium_andersonii.AAC.1